MSRSSRVLLALFGLVLFGLCGLAILSASTVGTVAMEVVMMLAALGVVASVLLIGSAVFIRGI